MQQTVRLIAITLVLIALQTTIIPFLSVLTIVPDVMMIWIVVIAVTRGQIPATLFGFGIGLTIDIASGQFLGLSALTKTVAGFIAGYFFHENKVEMTLGTYRFLVIVGVSALVHNVIYFVIFTSGSEVSLLAAVFRFGLFSALYTTLVAFIPMFITKRAPHLR